MVDERLAEIRGRRPGKLRQQDLDPLARMIIAVLRKRGTAGVGLRGGVEVAILSDNKGTLTILKDDWALILPFLQDGTFNPLIVPAAARFGYQNSSTAYAESVIDRADRFLFNRIHKVLRGLFTETYPTSNL